MANYSVYRTNKGTELPLMNLKGKPYMQVAHRLVWFTEEVPSFTTKTEFIKVTEEETVAKVTLTIFGQDGKIIKQTEATKREDKKAFMDHTEKAETGALGRALALAGYGTQFAVADMDEGDRLADSPVATVQKSNTQTLIETAKEVVKSGEVLGVTIDVKAGTATPVVKKDWSSKAKKTVTQTNNEGY